MKNKKGKLSTNINHKTKKKLKKKKKHVQFPKHQIYPGKKNQRYSFLVDKIKPNYLKKNILNNTSEQNKKISKPIKKSKKKKMRL